MVQSKLFRFFFLLLASGGLVLVAVHPGAHAAAPCPSGPFQGYSVDCGRVTQAVPGGSDANSQVNDSLNNLNDLLIKLTNIIFGALAVLIIINAGIHFITSNGNQEQAKTARATLINAVLGIALLVAGWTVMRLIVQLGVYIAQRASG